MASPVVGIIMGSRSDWGVMENAAQTLDELGVAYEAKVVSAHRTPDRLYEYAKSCLLYTSPSPRDYAASRMPSSA